MSQKNFLKKLFIPQILPEPEQIEPGLYHSMEEDRGDFTRFHLRVEPDGNGMLIANATAAARLSPGGVIIAKRLLEKTNEPDILRELNSKFVGATQEQLQADLLQIKTLIYDLRNPGDVFPILNLEDPIFSPYSSKLIAPLEATTPLTSPEIIKPILKKIWDIGIPHVTILFSTGQNPADLVAAVEYTESLGLICGASGRASDLVKDKLIYDIAMAGIDHVTVFYASANAEIHDLLFGKGDHAASAEVFKKTQELGIADIGHIPLIQDTTPYLEETLSSLLEMEVPNAAFYAIAASEPPDNGAIPASAMRQIATQVEEDSHSAQVRYIWEPPTRFNPKLSLVEQVRKGPRCSGDAAIRVEPDGTVYPPRGPRQSAGNLLKDDWDSIWKHEVFTIYRERVETPTRCDICPGLAICAADCPQEPKGWAEE